MKLAPIARTVMREVWTPPDRRSVTEWAAANRILPDTSTAPGPYDPTVTPYVRRPLDLTADPSVPMIVLVWAAQTTKSTVIENAVAWRIANAPTPIVAVQPKIEAAEAWMKERIVPMIRATPVLMSKVSLGKSTESTLRYKRFPGGFFFCAAAGSPAELASRSSPFLVLDEVDRMQPTSEGSPIRIVLARQNAADVAQVLMTSTPGDAETTEIWPYLEAGTHELYHVPCPHCGTMQPLVFGGSETGHGLKWEPDQPDTAHYVCVEGCVIEEMHKPEMLARGEWVATNPAGEYPSFHLNGLYSPFTKANWASLVRDFLQSKGKPADLQVFVNTRLAELWTETADVIDPSSLRSRAVESWEPGTVPAGVGVLSAGVDVQENRVEVWVWGWGAGLESWPILHEVIPGDPQAEGAGSIWPQVWAVLGRTFPHAESGRRLPVAVAFVDTGAYTKSIYRALRGLGRRRIFGCKGVGGPVPLLGKVQLQGDQRVPVYPVGVDQAKTLFLRSNLATREVGPGYVHLPEWLTDDELAQLVSEKRKRKVVRGRVTYEWQPIREGEPTEALDCRNYARAGVESLGDAVVRSLGDEAAKWATPPEDPPPPAPAVGPQLPPPTRPAPRRAGGWVSRWK